METLYNTFMKIFILPNFIKKKNAIRQNIYFYNTYFADESIKFDNYNLYFFK